MIVALDASPLSLLTQRRGVAEGEACRRWAHSLAAAGIAIMIPAIADYEVRRELLRARKTTSVAKLDALRNNPAFGYIPMSDAALTRAASLWAEIRQRGLPTAGSAELDCDVVFIAILMTANIPQDQIVIATSNVGHLSRFLKAEAWQAISP